MRLPYDVVLPDSKPWPIPEQPKVGGHKHGWTLIEEIGFAAINQYSIDRIVVGESRMSREDFLKAQDRGDISSIVEWNSPAWPDYQQRAAA